MAPFFYAGTRYEDPINGKTYRKFLPYGYSGKSKRSNVLAPGTLSLERHRLLWLYLRDKTDLFVMPHKVLHIAPEQCFNRLFREMLHLDYTSGDLNSPLADIHFDLHRAPFGNDTFSVILCNHVLEHVEDATQCMKELYRIMKPGGWGIFQVPIDMGLRETYEDKRITDPRQRAVHFGQKDHLRLFGRDYKQKLESAGFIVSEDSYVQNLPEALIERYRLPRDESIYFCKKSIYQGEQPGRTSERHTAYPRHPSNPEQACPGMGYDHGSGWAKKHPG